MRLSGFGNYHQSEAIAGALPQNQNSPQKTPFGLYAEQLSGSAFTCPRHTNLRSWCYRLLPSVVTKAFTPFERAISQPFLQAQPPNPMRWSKIKQTESHTDFIDGLFHVAGNSIANCYIYNADLSMDKRFLYNADGELLILPQHGQLLVRTEFGELTAKPGQFIVIPRGIKFQVQLIDNLVYGYVCENTKSPMALPDLGPIGANGLANPRDFHYPEACFDDKKGDYLLISKYQHQWWQAELDYSPLNVVAWHGNYAPYHYCLSNFNTINSVSFDHPDPSIFTVLTSQSNNPGVANLDFVIFPERWMVAEHTFRPPYYHRNIMSELMGLIFGQYDAKTDGFEPGGISIHNTMTAHGPDVNSYQKAVKQDLKPERYQSTLAFMFETRKPWSVTQQALSNESFQKSYYQCWQSLIKANIV
jgi:homogentisate 1,2-dioxygenase